MTYLHLPLHVDQCQHFYLISYTMAHLPYNAESFILKKCNKLMQIMPCGNKMQLHILFIMHLAYEWIWLRGVFLRCIFHMYPLFLLQSTFHNVFFPWLCGRARYQYYILFRWYSLSTITQPLSWSQCQTL